MKGWQAAVSSCSDSVYAMTSSEDCVRAIPAECRQGPASSGLKGEDGELVADEWAELHECPIDQEAAQQGIHFYFSAGRYLTSIRRMGAIVGTGSRVKKSSSTVLHRSGFSTSKPCDVPGITANSPSGRAR
jgi:hypothetical protein